MGTITPRKHAVVLSDYNFERDLNIRLFLAQFTKFEVSVIDEIINGSLKITIKQISNAISANEKTLIPFLKKLEEYELLKIHGDTLQINKEMRKYFSYEIEKFSSTFEPDLQHLPALLLKVPIHILPQWYAISRTSDNIFNSIIEKYFHTPKLYRKHVDELKIETPNLYKVYKFIMDSENLRVSSEELMEKFKLDHKEFESLMLELEYNFLACLCYMENGNGWTEYATLFHEWKLFNNCSKDSRPTALPLDDVQKHHESDFYFIEELSRLMELLQDKTSLKLIKKEFNNFTSLIDVAEDLLLVANDNDNLVLSNHIEKNWQRKTKQEQATLIYRLVMNYTRDLPEKIAGCNERELREISHSLKSIVYKGWFFFDDYFHSFIGIIRKHQPIELHQRGKKWRYKLPEYSNEDKHFVYTIIFDYLTKAGVISTGTCNGRPCFTVTPFGRMTLGD